MKPSLILGSSSPRRSELLTLAGFTYLKKPAGIDEALSPKASPEDAVLELSLRKAEAVQVSSTDVLLTADTIVSLEGMILGKPITRAEAYDYLVRLSGRTHDVFTGVTIKSQDHSTSFFVKTSVTFYSLNEREISSYVESGEGFDKAGGYGIQGKGALLVDRICGDYYNVVGLPISRVVRELRAFGIHPDSF